MLGGLGVFALGYLLTLFFGGKASLGLVDFTSQINQSKHAIQVKTEEEQKTCTWKDYTPYLYTPALVLLISLAIAVNIHYLDATFNVTFQALPNPIIQTILLGLDIFLKPTSLGSLRYSLEIIPIMVFFVAAGGIVPSIVLPYLRKFKINSFNGVPFHKNIVYSAVGAVFVLTIILSLVNIVYGVLIGTQPHYYIYLLPTILGFSLHYFLGAYLALGKAEVRIIKSLKTECHEGVFEGKIVIQKSD